LGWGGVRRDPSRSKDALRMTSKNKQRRRTGNDKSEGGDFVGERGGGLGWGGVRRDPSRSKDALRMTA
jgi:hypothetical protein